MIRVEQYIPPILVEKYKGNQYSVKFFLVGLSLGLAPYLIHIKVWA
jgi:hypothetical protein